MVSCWSEICFGWIKGHLLTMNWCKDRRVETSAPKKITPWIVYNHDARQGKYSSMKWKAEHFSGTDWDQRGEKHAIFKIIDDPANFPKPGHEDPDLFKKGMHRISRFFSGKKSDAKSRKDNTSAADVIQWSGCKDDQTVRSRRWRVSELTHRALIRSKQARRPARCLMSAFVRLYRAIKLTSGIYRCPYQIPAAELPAAAGLCAGRDEGQVFPKTAAFGLSP